MVPPAEVEPAKARKVFPELFFESLDRFFERVAVLFAQRVHMQPVQKGQNALVEF